MPDNVTVGGITYATELLGTAHRQIVRPVGRFFTISPSSGTLAADPYPTDGLLGDGHVVDPLPVGMYAIRQVNVRDGVSTDPIPESMYLAFLPHETGDVPGCGSDGDVFQPVDARGLVMTVVPVSYNALTPFLDGVTNPVAIMEVAPFAADGSLNSDTTASVKVVMVAAAGSAARTPGDELVAVCVLEYLGPPSTRQD